MLCVYVCAGMGGPPPPPGVMHMHGGMPPMMMRPPHGYGAPLHYPSQDPTRMGTASGAGNPDAAAAASKQPAADGDDADAEGDTRSDSPLLPPGESESDYTRTEDM